MRISSDLVAKFLVGIPVKSIPTQYLHPEIDFENGLIRLHQLKARTKGVSRKQALKTWHNRSSTMFCAIKGLLLELGMDMESSVGLYRAKAEPGILTIYIKKKLGEPSRIIS